MTGKKTTAKRKPKAKSAPAVQKPTDDRPAKSPGSTPRTGSKIATLLTLLRRPGGATIEALAKATEWQVHSVRGAISGTIKKKLGLTVKSERRGDGERIYSIA